MQEQNSKNDNIIAKKKSIINIALLFTHGGYTYENFIARGNSSTVS